MEEQPLLLQLLQLQTEVVVELTLAELQVVAIREVEAWAALVL
jgi:hypothetical protein